MSHIAGGDGTPVPAGTPVLTGRNQRPITLTDNRSGEITIDLPFFFSVESEKDVSLSRGAGQPPFIVRGRTIKNRTDNDETLPGNSTFRSKITSIELEGVRDGDCTSSGRGSFAPADGVCTIKIFFDHR